MGFAYIVILGLLGCVSSQLNPPILDIDSCPSDNLPYNVDGFPGSPFVLKPFQEVFHNPLPAQVHNKECRADGHCMYSYNIDVVDRQIYAFNATIPTCATKPGTWFMTYNGSVPGPTIEVPSGHESYVRFNNKIGNYFTESHKPCTGNRTGHPFSVHFHGSASLAPYDGWAEDETCFGESKNYVYPNNRPTTGWYHDHALHITAENANNGLAGLYLITDKCNAPWNIADIEEKHMILSDKLIDSECQLYIDKAGAHKDDLYGDINLVSGIPFPRMPLEPKQYRFRLLNAALSRSYLIQIKVADTLVNVHQSICKVVASDGGYSPAPVSLTNYGLRMGVAERYDMICDFTAYAGKTLYMWNDKDDKMLKAIPHFCYSHLIARLEIGTTVSGPAPVMDAKVLPKNNFRYTDNVIDSTVVAQATKMIKAGKFHRKMAFGRSMGQWTINGETWESFKIAAADIGHNSWELWMFESGGGWFHPVHMHLVDFYILHRDSDGGVQPYERLTPKDVLYLGPANKVFAIARFGAHKGDYMFHCHNLIHEDDDMMRAMRVIDNGMTSRTNTGNQFMVINNIVYSNYRYYDPMLTETSAKPSNEWPSVIEDASNKLNENVYRIFYPKADDKQLQNVVNPWKVTWACPAL
jgi:FtsP/CotA-like multicopper oxidase with cupredoxin domain